MFALLLKATLFLLPAIFIVTQMFIPAVTGKRFFPWFTKERKLEEKLEEVTHIKREFELADKLAKEVDKLNKKEKV